MLRAFLGLNSENAALEELMSNAAYSMPQRFEYKEIEAEAFLKA